MSRFKLGFRPSALGYNLPLYLRFKPGKLEFGSALCRIARRKPTAVALNNAVADRQAQPGTLAYGLGGIEQVENFAHLLFRYSRHFVIVMSDAGTSLI
jgi:hypothetical protein